MDQTPAHTFLGIELGSTRIKAVLNNERHIPIAAGSYSWENRFENGIWTYSLDDIRKGVQSCFKSLAEDFRSKFGCALTTADAMGVSAMMHGYMAFDENDDLLVPFRTWRNTSPKEASEELSGLLGFNIPRRWSIAHLYQAILDEEEHVPRIARITTPAGYVNFLLTGDRALGIGDASGVFPTDKKGYNAEYIAVTEKKFAEHGFTRPLIEVLPPVRSAGEKGAVLTEKGAAFLDPDGNFKAGVPVCPPEGDAGTGMAAANAVKSGTGSVSAGTSVFSMLVLDKPLKGHYPEIDIVATPDGSPTAMVHCNNCCSEIDGWIKVLEGFAKTAGLDVDTNGLYKAFFTAAANGAADCGGVTAYNLLSGEPAAAVEMGRPMYFRTPDSQLDFNNFTRAQIYSAFAALRIGMDILFDKEKAAAVSFTAQGGMFKTGDTAVQILADALNTPCSVTETAGEGGAWGMALLAAYMYDGKGKTLGDWLESEAFPDMEKREFAPERVGREGFNAFMKRYKAALPAERMLSEE